MLMRLGIFWSGNEQKENERMCREKERFFVVGWEGGFNGFLRVFYIILVHSFPVSLPSKKN